MKVLIILGLILISKVSLASGYEPFKFTCVYDATHDGMITTTSRIDPDLDDWTVEFKSTQWEEPSIEEASSAYVYGKDEKVDTDTKKMIDALVKILKINTSKWFTTTDITIAENTQKQMKFFKFNSRNGTLGIGIHVEYLGQDIYTVCK